MLYIYIIISVLVILVAFRCLRSRYNGVIPVFMLSFFISSILTAITCTVIYYNSDKVSKIDKTNDIAHINISENRFVCGNVSYSFNSFLEKGIHKNGNYKTTRLIVSEYYKDCEFISETSLLPVYSSDSVIYDFYLNKNDYAVFETYKNNVN